MKNDSIEMFEGYWKYFGVIGVILLGAALTWWGINIMLNDWVEIYSIVGIAGLAVLAPLIVGLILTWLGCSEFLNMFRE